MEYKNYPNGKYKGIYRIDSSRCEKWDYSSPSSYYVTICSWDKQPFFSRYKNNKLELSNIGILCKRFLLQIPDNFQNCSIDEFVIMPDHIHAIITIHKKTETTLGDIVKFLKGNVTHAYNETARIPQKTLWQERYHDRIIRDENELEATRTYIRSNPEKGLENYFD